MGKEIKIYCRMNAYKRLIFFKWMQAIRTCGYSILSCGKSSNGNFEVLYITLLLWRIKYIVLIIAFKTFFEKSRLEWWRHMYCFFFTTISKWVCCWRTEKSTFQPVKIFLFYILWQNYISYFLSRNFEIFRRLIPTILYFWKRGR